jgi:lipoprotein-anchoring transpeptidase ErfK/SrfK
MKRPWIKTLITIVFICIIISGLGWLFVKLIPNPPMREIEEARVAISDSRKHNSVIYSTKIFKESRSFYDSAMIAWKTENKRFILFRDYERVRKFAILSEKKAAEATKRTIAKANDMKSNLQHDLVRLNDEVKAFEKIFSTVPLPQDIKKKNAKGKLLLKEAQIAYDKGQYVSGNVKVTEAGDYITDSYSSARKKLSDYFRNYQKWQDWAKITINESKENNSYAIIVEKVPGLCHVYYKGVRKYTFDAEFGENWMGDKMTRGDAATPEGRYQITRKLQNGSTKYHKALMINYPNEEDLAEFKRRISTGSIPSNAKIGGLIEIHGEGGKGGNWTEGCIALKNSDIDTLFKLVSSGTPVTIIGSTTTLNQIMSEN